MRINILNIQTARPLQLDIATSRDTIRDLPNEEAVLRSEWR